MFCVCFCVFLLCVFFNGVKEGTCDLAHSRQALNEIQNPPFRLLLVLVLR